jgi:transposase
MKTTRKRYSADFKAKVAMEAIRGDLTLAELAAKHGVHHTMIGAWKRQAMDGMASLFDGGDQAAKASSEAEIEKARQDRAVAGGAGFLARASGR